MRKTLSLIAAVLIVFAPVASAQNMNSGAQTKSGTAGTPKASTATAPVGHRQPTAADVGKADDDLARSAEDKELDRKIKNICKGC